MLVVVVTIAVSALNLLHAFYIILTSGVGKNGSTVAVRAGACVTLYDIIQMSCWEVGALC